MERQTKDAGQGDRKQCVGANTGDLAMRKKFECTGAAVDWEDHWHVDAEPIDEDGCVIEGYELPVDWTYYSDPRRPRKEGPCPWQDGQVVEAYLVRHITGLFGDYEEIAPQWRIRVEHHGPHTNLMYWPVPLHEIHEWSERYLED